MIKKLYYALFIITLFFNSFAANATCTVLPASSINLNTGNNPIYSSAVYNTPLTGSNIATTALSCTGLTIQVLAGQKVDVILQTAIRGLKNTNGSGDTIPYQMYADKDYAYPFTSGQVLHFGSLKLLNIVLGSTTLKVPFYIKTNIGANIQAGTYTEQLTFSWDYDICSGILGVCLLGRDKGTGSTVLTITANIDKTCALNQAADVNFGSYSMIGQFNPMTQTINLSCTKTEGYKVSFSDGNNRLAGSWRRMSDGAGHFIQYNLYQSNGTTVIDSNNKVTNIGTGLAQDNIYKAIINPTQAEVPAGDYTDTVSLLVEY